MSNVTTTLLMLTFGGTVLALLLLAVRYVFFRKMPSTFYYYAWLLVLLRFLLPLPGLLPIRTTAQTPGVTAAAAETRTPQQNSELPAFSVNEVPGETPKETVFPVFSETAPEETRLRQTVKKDTAAGSLSTMLHSQALWLGIWSLGFALSLIRYWVGYLLFASELRGHIRRALDWRDFSLGDGRKPSLWVADGVYSPMLVGFRKPMIVLPEGDYDHQTLQNILRHELMHYRRRDILYKWFAVFVFSAQWFNPVMYLVRREINRACELSCDEMVIRAMTREEKQSYGETLLLLAANRTLPAAVTATTFSTEKRNLKERLLQIMKYRLGRKSLCAAAAVVAVLAVLGLMLGPHRGKAEPFARAEFEKTGSTMAEARMVTVSDVDGLLAAIGPNTEIRLENGTYDLSQAANYGKNSGSPWYSWEQTFDGYQLTIQNVENLAIRGREADAAQIITAPRYSHVLNFSGCRNVWLQDFTAGHSPEQGTCVGGVLRFAGSSRADVYQTKLFGCGTVAVYSEKSQNLAVRNSDLYECSYNAVVLEHTTQMAVEQCRIYDMDCIDALFVMDVSKNVQISGCDIEANSSSYLMRASDSDSVQFRDNRVADNTFLQSGFLLSRCAPVIDGCTFENNHLTRWYHPESGYAVKAGGEVWMEPRESASPAGGSLKRVSTVEELLCAIGPDTTVELAPGTYDLSDVSDYGNPIPASEYYTWEEVPDGFQLRIQNVSNFTLLGTDGAEIVTEPRYANVLCFYGCENVKLSGFTAGHTPEPGYCSGGVLFFESCRLVDVEDTRLYGCGVVGVQGRSCESLRIYNSEIYECSEGAVYLSMCANATIENCRIRDVRQEEEYDFIWGWLFQFHSCNTVRVTGCTIENNCVGVMLRAGTAFDVQFLSNRVENNQFDDMFEFDGMAATVDGCAFENNTVKQWYKDGITALDRNGDFLTEFQLQKMQLEENLSVESLEIPEVTPEKVGGEIHVKTVDEFLAAIASDTVIVLEDGDYDLWTASNYGRQGLTGSYCWEESYDGPALVITGVSNLTIRSSGGDWKNCRLSAAPRYANVVEFRNCSDVALSGINLGHSKESGSCSGDVVSLSACRNMTFDGCGFYGCGVTGIYATSCDSLKVKDCEIYDCSSNGMQFYSVRDAVLENCRFRNLGGDGIYLFQCTGVQIDGCAFSEIAGQNTTVLNSTQTTLDGHPIAGELVK